MKNRAVFLDRDGTINEEVGHLDDLGKLRLLPNAVAAVRLINNAGMKAIVVTNQSGIARGLFSEGFLHEVHRRISEIMSKDGAVIDRFYYCPHHPVEGIGSYLRACSCRKPAAGMLHLAAREMKIDLDGSFFIGDTSRDMEAATAAGVRGVLVKTGYGRDEMGLVSGEITIAEDILDAVRWIIREGQR